MMHFSLMTVETKMFIVQCIETKIINVLKHSYLLLFQMKSLAVEVRIILQRNQLLREASAQDELEVPPGNVI